MAGDVTDRNPVIDATNELIAACEAELAIEEDPLRAARLHCELGLTFEEALADLDSAAEHYHEALARAPEHLPSLRGARRVLTRLGRHREALSHYDGEARLIADPKRKALLLYDKGVVLESHLGDAGAARLTYATALDLDRNNPTLLKALERCHAAADDRAELDRIYEQMPNVISDDVHHRAALLIRRARFLAEDRRDEKIELYETALRLDPSALGAIESLKRLYHQARSWQKLVSTLEREAVLTCDDSLRAHALYRIGATNADQRHNRAEALAAFEQALEVAPKDRLTLEDVARLYEASEDHEPLARVLATMVEGASEAGERIALLHKLGQLYDSHLDNEDRAIRCYRAALKFEPTYIPGLQALGKIYQRNQSWVPLVEMHLAEASGSDDANRRAAAHARIAEVYEVHLQQPAEAGEHHARALALVPGYPASFKALTRLYRAAGQFRELIELYERAIDKAPSTAHKITWLFEIGALWEDSLDDSLQAAHAYRRILAVDGDSLRALHALQRASERAGRHQELVDALELEADKTDDVDQIVGLLHRAATVLDDQLGDRDAALVRFRKVLELNPTFVPALASLGRIYYRDGRWDDLLSMYLREFDVTPQGPAALALLFRMGELCEQRLGRNDEAVDYYRQAAVMDPTHRPALRALVRMLEDSQSWARLPDIFELELSGLKAPATRAATLYRLGVVHEDRLGNPDQAVDAYQRALAELPTYRPAIDALTRLRTENQSWAALVDDLTRDADNSQDPVRCAAALMRQAELWRDKLDQPARAIGCLEALVETAPGHLPALLALEPLYAAAENWPALAHTYQRQAQTFTDVGARIAALRELARVRESKHVGDASELVTVYDSILAVAPDDQSALRALARIGHATANRVLLTRVEARLGASAEDPAVAAHHFVCLGHTLEEVDEGIALDAYRGALAKDPDCLSALRGLSRLAERCDDHATLADALRREANLTRRNRAAANLYLRSAIVRRARLQDEEGALVDLELALERWPDDVNTIAALSEILTKNGRSDRLVDLLSRAADASAAPTHKASLWMEVGRLYADVLDNRGAAAAALTRALHAVPDHVPTMRRLADLQATNRQWDTAVELLERLLEIAPEAPARCETHLTLAALFDEKMVEPKRALAHANAVLEEDATNQGALYRLLKIHKKSGDISLAIDAARQLVEVTTGSEAHAAALLGLARLEREHGEPDAALSALLDAMISEGPHTPAAAELRDMIDHGHGDWSMYADALAGYIADGELATSELEELYLELADVKAQKLGDDDGALATLESGLSQVGASTRLVAALGGRSDQALDHLRDLLAEDIARAETWRMYHRALEHAGEGETARRALAPLALFGLASASELATLDSESDRASRARARSFDNNALRTIAVDNAMSTPAADLLAVLGAAVAKLHPADLDDLGLSKRDRIAPRNPHAMRPLIDELVELFAVGDYDLYEHMLPTPLATVEPTDPPAIVFAEQAATLPNGQQLFLFAHAMACLAAHCYPILKLSAAELERLLTAAAHSVVSSFTGALDDDPDLDSFAQLIHKATPRKLRKQKEEAARRYIASPCKDFAAWSSALGQTTVRAALLLSSDLVAAVAMLKGTHPSLVDLEGEELVRAAPPIADLIRFWMSDEAAAFRRRAGLR